MLTTFTTNTLEGSSLQIVAVIMQTDSLKQLLQLVLLHTAWEIGSGQLHYSVPEESQHGTFVGRVAQDLGLEVSELVPRMFRMESQDDGDYFRVSLQNGVLFVNSRIDREELCGKSPLCAVHLEVIVDKPLKVFHVEVEIADINDNAPVFSVAEQTLMIAESRLPHSPFPLESASDADIGTNALLTYKISPNDYFRLNVVTNEDDTKSAGLELKKPLDREDTSVHHLLLTATDGGKPELTGTLQLMIHVLDVNDNAPLFSQSVYKIRLPENQVNGTLIITLNATDLDDGISKDISYSFSSLVSSKVKRIFQINERTGEIRVAGPLDYEDVNLWEIQVVAEDKGNPPLAGHCKVVVEILDMNDNAPQLSLKSLSVPVPEDSPLGMTVALISISDRDSGANGRVSCSLWPLGLPFKLMSTFKNYYSLVLEEPLDREQLAEYVLVVMAHDEGTPPLSASSTLLVPIGDINDNAPAFSQPTYTVFVKENNPPGAHIFTVSASDPDVEENSLISYWLDEKLWTLSSYISVHSESGKLYALQPLDYEEMKLLEFQVRAKDAGMPSLCGNVTVQVFVIDENDNAPTVSGLMEVPVLLVVPIAAGHVVGKIHALDADSGYNAWLRYELHEATNGPWRVGLYTGEISTTHAMDEAGDGGNSRILLVLVKDHGRPMLSATATLSMSIVASTQAIHADAHLIRMGGNSKPQEENVNIYLIIAICSVSSLFVLGITVYIVLRCQCQAKEPMVYGPGTATLVCASEVGSWSYSNRHSHILAGVSGDGGAKSDLMVFSPNIPVFATNGDTENTKEIVPNSSEQPKPPNPDWRYSASLRAGMQGAVHMEEAGALRGGPGGPEQQWPTVSSATTDPEGGEVSPPVGAGVNSNSWTFKYGPGNSKQPGPGELPDKFIIPGSPAIISIRQDPPNSQTDKSDFITFGKKEETKKKKKKKKGNKAQEKKEKGNSTTDNSDQ
ncbi:protocadherin alpha-3 isoform X3 [Pogona vitticeps]